MVTLGEKDDQKIFQDDSFAAHPSVDSWGETRTRLDCVLGHTQDQEHGSRSKNPVKVDAWRSELEHPGEWNIMRTGDCAR